MTVSPKGSIFFPLCSCVSSGIWIAAGHFWVAPQLERHSGLGLEIHKRITTVNATYGI